MFKRITAVLLCAAVSVGASMQALAEAPEQVYTGSVVRELGAKAVTWDGKTELEAGGSYVVTKDITISSKGVVIPHGATLTVKNGAKLWVNSKGSLIIGGKLTVAKGAKLAVSGYLEVSGEGYIGGYGNGTLNVNGELRFGSKSNARFDGGKTVISSTGSVYNKPKSLFVHANATVSIKGKDNGKAFTEPLKKRSLSVKARKYLYMAMAENDLYSALCYMYPKSYLDTLDSKLREAGTDLETFCQTYDELMASEYSDEAAFNTDITCWNVGINEYTEATSLTAEEKAAAKAICGNSSYKVYDVSAKLSVSEGCILLLEEQLSLRAVYSGGKWYVFGEI